jgi:hypothetical protein
MNVISYYGMGDIIAMSLTWQAGNSHARASSRASRIESAAATQRSAVLPYADVPSEDSWED